MSFNGLIAKCGSYHFTDDMLRALEDTWNLMVRNGIPDCEATRSLADLVESVRIEITEIDGDEDYD